MMAPKSYLEQFASYSDEDLAAQLKQAEKQKNTVIESRNFFLDQF
ncbi:MAG: hypothetical protein ACLT76_01410 [Clostridium fessum]